MSKSATQKVDCYVMHYKYILSSSDLRLVACLILGHLSKPTEYNNGLWGRIMCFLGSGTFYKNETFKIHLWVLYVLYVLSRSMNAMFCSWFNWQWWYNFLQSMQYSDHSRNPLQLLMILAWRPVHELLIYKLTVWRKLGQDKQKHVRIFSRTRTRANVSSRLDKMGPRYSKHGLCGCIDAGKR